VRQTGEKTGENGVSDSHCAERWQGKRERCSVLLGWAPSGGKRKKAKGLPTGRNGGCVGHERSTVAVISKREKAVCLEGEKRSRIVPSKPRSSAQRLGKRGLKEKGRNRYLASYDVAKIIESWIRRKGVATCDGCCASISCPALKKALKPAERSGEVQW